MQIVALTLLVLAGIYLVTNMDNQPIRSLASNMVQHDSNQDLIGNKTCKYVNYDPIGLKNTML